MSQSLKAIYRNLQVFTGIYRYLQVFMEFYHVHKPLESKKSDLYKLFDHKGHTVFLSAAFYIFKVIWLPNLYRYIDIS